MATPEATVRREILARVPAFSGLESRQLDELAQVTHTRRLKPKEELCHKGDPGTQVWVIVKGRLRAVTSSVEGGDVQFSIMDPGEVCGELALFAGGSRTATMTAVDDVELLSLDRRDFIPFLKRNPDAAIHLLEAMAERVRRLSEQMEDRVFLGLPARLAKKLLSLASQYGEETEGGGVRIEMRLSQGELGTMVGTSRESVNKQMRAWEGAGIVQSERGVITLISEAELEDVAGSGDGS